MNELKRNIKNNIDQIKYELNGEEKSEAICNLIFDNQNIGAEEWDDANLTDSWSEEIDNIFMSEVLLEIYIKEHWDVEEIIDNLKNGFIGDYCHKLGGYFLNGNDMEDYNDAADNVLNEIEEITREW